MLQALPLVDDLAESDNPEDAEDGEIDVNIDFEAEKNHVHPTAQYDQGVQNAPVVVHEMLR